MMGGEVGRGAWVEVGEGRAVWGGGGSSVGVSVSVMVGVSVQGTSVGGGEVEVFAVVGEGGSSVVTWTEQETRVRTRTINSHRFFMGILHLFYEIVLID